MRLIKFSIILILLCFIFSPSLIAKDLSEVNIGIVLDGPSFRNDFLLHNITKEIKDLIGNEFNVYFPEDKTLVGDWTSETAEYNANELLHDKDVDIVLGLGFLASSYLVENDQLNKPVIAAMVSEEMLDTIPFTGSTSGRNNLNYVVSFSAKKKALQEFKKLTPFKNLVIFANKNYYDSTKKYQEKVIKDLENALDTKITPIFVGNNIDEAIKKIPSDCDAVYLYPMFNLTEAQLRELINKINTRKLPSFSYIGNPELQLGVLATINPEYDLVRLSRFIAINVQDIILGSNSSELPVIFKPGERLIINMETARKIGFSPKWETLTDARVINFEDTTTEDLLSLDKVIQDAIAANLDIKAKEFEIKASRKDIAIARSELLPQISYSGQFTQLDKKRALARPGSVHRSSMDQSLEVSQLLFSEPAFANVTVQKNIYRSNQADLKTLELDIASDAATAYLNVLKSKTLLKIEADNLELSRNNLELAQIRMEVGVSTAAEVYRWQSSIASNRSSVIDAAASLELAKLELNKILDRELEAPFITTEIDLTDPLLITSQRKLMKYMSDPWKLKVFRDFMVLKAIDAAPEVAQLDELIKAKKRQLSSAKRKFWTPTAALEADFDHQFMENNVFGQNRMASGQTPNNFEWSLGVNVSIPIFSGGERIADLLQTKEELQQLQYERRSIVQQIDQRMRSAIINTSSTYPNIELMRQAAEASKKNLELVSDSYKKGKSSIVDLLDAQNSYFVADQLAASAVYDYVTDIIDIQRAVGKINFKMNDIEWQNWFTEIEEYYRKNGVKF